MSLNVPVLLILHERQPVSPAMFDGIRTASPKNLSVAVPSHSRGAEDDIGPELQEQLDELIDWPCHLQVRRFPGPSSLAESDCKAISWFLQEADRGIIIRAGFRTSADFFDFCARGLETYANRPDVWHISGSSLGAPRRLFGDADAAFTSVVDTTCWATWRDRWEVLSSNPFFVAADARRSSKDWKLSAMARFNVLQMLDELKEGRSCWESLWQATMLHHSGVALCPDRPLVMAPPEDSATMRRHGTETGRRGNETAEGSSEPAYSRGLDRWLEKAKGLRSPAAALRCVLATGARQAALTTNRVLAKVFFGRVSESIIVASNGRSGSTMLCNAIADSLVRERFGKSLPKIVKRFLREVASEFVPRLQQSGRYAAPVVKTHDRPGKDTNIEGKAIFIFGDPLESVLSAQLQTERAGLGWLQKHLFHLRSSGHMDDLLNSDVLGFSDQCRAWRDAPQETVMLVAFDDLWNRQEEISRFLGFRVALPPQRPRRPKPTAPQINRELFDTLRAEYGRMQKHSIEQLESM